MLGEIAIRDVQATAVAIVRRRARRGEIPKRIIGWYDAVYAALRAAAASPGGKLGHNVAVYRKTDGDELAVECGVQIEHPFEPLGEVVCSRTPAGRVAAVTYTGPYAGIHSGHSAVEAFMRDRGLPHAGVLWEIYGDWDDDPAKLHTELLHLVG